MVICWVCWLVFAYVMAKRKGTDAVRIIKAAGESFPLARRFQAEPAEVKTRLQSRSDRAPAVHAHMTLRSDGRSRT